MNEKLWLYLFVTVSIGMGILALVLFFIFRNFEYGIEPYVFNEGQNSQIIISQVDESGIKFEAYFQSNATRYEFVRPKIGGDTIRVVLYDLDSTRSPQVLGYKLDATVSKVSAGDYMIEIYDNSSKTVLIQKKISIL